MLELGQMIHLNHGPQVAFCQERVAMMTHDPDVSTEDSVRA